MASPERVALVTGASAGIGFHTALGLARAGYRVIMAGRDAVRLADARRAVAARAGVAEPDTLRADFSRLAEVRGLAEAVLSRHEQLDVLVNNAGLIVPRFHLSEEGYELTVAVNHLAPFLLTNLLLDRLRASAQPDATPRIVTVASRAHRGARLELASFLGPQGWSPLKAYGRSKLCNILFTRALARRLAPGEVVAACLHPGVVATRIGNSAGGIAGWGWQLVRPFLITAESGAETSLFLATTEDPGRFHGAYLIGRRIVRPDPVALNDTLGEQLWSASMRLVGL